MNRRYFLSALTMVSLSTIAGCFHRESRKIRVSIISQYPNEKELEVKLIKNEGDVLFRQLVTVNAKSADYDRIDTVIASGESEGTDLEIVVEHSERTVSRDFSLDCSLDTYAGDEVTVRIDVDGSVKMLPDGCYEG